MRRTLTACALAAALAAPAVAHADPRGDGTVSVKHATGSVALVARGVILGHCDRCTVIIDDPHPNYGAAPVVTGYEQKDSLSDTRTSWCCDRLRFKIIGGFFRIKVIGTGIDISAIASGQVVLNGLGAGGGTYSLGGGPESPLPDFRAVLLLGG